MNAGNALERAKHFLGGLKLSFLLLIVLGLLVAQRAIIAQRFVYADELPWFLKLVNRLGLDSPDTLETPLLVVLGLFVLNLVLAGLRMARRIRAKQRVFRGMREEGALRALSNSEAFRTYEDSSSRVVDFFQKSGFRVRSENSGSGLRLHAGRHLSGYWGVFLFHMTFLVVLVGVVLSLLTRQTGYVELSPGETFVEKRENYRRVTERPVLFDEDRDFEIRLEEIDLSYWKPGALKQLALAVSVLDDDGAPLKRERIQVNSPLSIEDTSVYAGGGKGFIAELEVTDAAGTTVKGTARFRIPRKPDDDMLSKVRLPGTTLDLSLELFTEKLGEMEGLEQFGPRHMATLLKVTSIEASAHRMPMFQGVVFEGQSLSFEGLTLKFKRLKPYVSFVVTRDYGVPVIFSGFVFLLLGLLIIYFWVPENYWAVIRKEGEGELVVIGAVTEKYRESFRDRFASQMEELKAELKAQ